MTAEIRYPEATVGVVILNPEDKVLICKSKYKKEIIYGI
ncbi:MAG: hypothetical protein AWL62_1759 [Halanaerobium sp. T82-1]|jgi:phage pi2 protein 07|nr:MAG: hypothetical protein AWL62_1759 [Halanaerobium sp. T82-1]